MMAARFPMPADLSVDELGSAGGAVARQVRLESAVERILDRALSRFMARALEMARHDRTGLMLGQLWQAWDAAIASAGDEMPAEVADWIVPIFADSEVPGLVYESAQAVFATGAVEGWPVSVIDDQLRLALAPDASPSESLVAAAARRKMPRHGAPWADLDAGGMKFMDRMKRDARTSVTGLDGLLTDRTLADKGFTRKRWVTRKDAKVRHTHVEAEGQTVPLAEPFIVGDYPLQYPGQRGAPPELIYNCRCVIVGTRWRAQNTLGQGRHPLFP